MTYEPTHKDCANWALNWLYIDKNVNNATNTEILSALVAIKNYTDGYAFSFELIDKAIKHYKEQIKCQ